MELRGLGAPVDVDLLLYGRKRQELLTWMGAALDLLQSPSSVMTPLITPQSPWSFAITGRYLELVNIGRERRERMVCH